MTTESGVTVTGAWGPGYERVLSPGALAFLGTLVRAFRDRAEALVAARRGRLAGFARGEFDFLPETRAIREGDWRVAPLPRDLLDRRVEITGPVDRKMIINALNSGASVFMADCEDASSPTWANMVEGQLNLQDAVRRTIAYEAPETGRRYALNEKTAVLLVRPRGWHLRERHVRVDGRDIPGGLFDFAMYFYHNVEALRARETGPYFYLPKLEHHREAELWNDVFNLAQDTLGVPRGTIKATVLIETLPAAFQMDEILYALREHSAGLNCGRWDYIFSFIKTRQGDATALLPDRAVITMDKGFLRAYSQLLIKTCHRRGVHAMGGMAAFIPIKNDAAANEAVLAKVRADKLREVTDGHDGTWVAHPGLVSLAREVFDAHMKGPNQIERLRDDVAVGREALLAVPEGPRTEHGLRHNIKVGIQYIEAWLRGQGCVPLYNLMEDAATAEISRAQVWQWVRYGVETDDGLPVTRARLEAITEEESQNIVREVGAERAAQGRFDEARALFLKLSLGEGFEEFLTVPAYAMLDDTAA